MATLALIGNLWRQSRRQVVFIILLIVFAVVSVGALFLFTVREDDKGKEHVGFVFSDEVDSDLDLMIRTALIKNMAENASELKRQRDEEGASKESTEEAAAGWKKQLEAYTKRTEFELESVGWAYLINLLAITIGMWLFIAASSGYFPGFMETGAIDVTLAKPISRLRAFMGTYLGGLAFMVAALLALQVIIYLGVGFRSGVWVHGVFTTWVLASFMAALLFAFVTLVSVWSRSATLALVGGLFLYIAVDTALGTWLLYAQSGALSDSPGWESAANLLRATIPNFSLIKGQMLLGVLGVDTMNWQPIYVGGIWLVICLALGYWIFRRRDF
ncbi:MAG: ABC transporter permease subunit [Planctomycetes bacterium]|nr:ABC transporter permease subunit [Planctomycetota bacterium]